jgi:uncharacterized membrane-anchored protein YjiN (DUF445 family)
MASTEREVVAGHSSQRIDRLARGCLLAALALAVLGKVLDHPDRLPFWGGLLAAFGEAALVGGLADWFAVRALFTHPFGIPFPHTALIPRNRERIIREVRNLVLKEWLPLSLMRSKLEKYDFVREALLPVMGPLRDHLRELFRAIGREILAGVDIKPLATLLARGLVNAAEGPRFAPFLADLAQRAREKGWLEPLVLELVRRMQQWASLPQCRRQIRLRLDHAAAAYRERDTIKDISFFVGKMVGAIDLDSAAEVIQGELRRFAADQLAPDSQVQSLLADGLASIEHRLRDDPTYLDNLRGMLRESNTLAALFEPVLLSLRDEAAQQLQGPDSPWLEIALRQVDVQVKRLETDLVWREQMNAWCRRLAIQQVEQHHGLIGTLVEEQMNRLSEENLSALIQSRVGEDLNWIRLNGTFVGGLIGVGLYLLAILVRRLSG